MNTFAAVRVDQAAATIDVGYHRFVASLDCADQAKHLRILGYEKFIGRFDDLDVWMRRPTPARLDT